MAWTDEIVEAAYTSPSGKRMAFNYDAGVERTTALKTAENTFPDVDGAEIQSLGVGGKKFPLTAIFSGADCFKDADSFEELLCERGYGVLEHPIYGKHTVVPTGEIARSDNLVTGLNESRVRVNFSETISDRAFPDSEMAAVDALDAAIDGYEAQVPDVFDSLLDVSSVEDAIETQSVLRKVSNAIFKGMSKVVELTSNLQEKMKFLQKIREFKTEAEKLFGQIDQIAANAQNIATVLIKTARLPAELAIGAMAKIEGYSSVINDIIKNVKKDPVGVKAVANQYAVTSTVLGALVASAGFGVAKAAYNASAGGSGAFGGSFAGGGSSAGGSADNAGGTTPVSSGVSASVSAGGFVSRASMLHAADLITEQFETYKEYMDSQVATDAFVDTGEGYAALLETVVAAVQVLEEASFDLPITRIVKLGRDRQVIELLCELYGTEGFDRLDQFITDNELTADEIVLLPMGREVRYYG